MYTYDTKNNSSRCNPKSLNSIIGQGHLNREKKRTFSNNTFLVPQPKK